MNKWNNVIRFNKARRGAGDIDLAGRVPLTTHVLSLQWFNHLELGFFAGGTKVLHNGLVVF